MPREFVHVTLEAWQAAGVERFGEDRATWRFVCPSCGHEQTVAECRAAGVPDGSIAFACVGRWLPVEPALAEAAFKRAGGPCNYTGGGLFRLNPVLVKHPEGESGLFDFAVRPLAGWGTTVVNLRFERYDVYIGRPGKGKDGYFGNPFALARQADAAARDEVMARYEEYFRERVARDEEFRTRVLALRGKRLGCFCKPGRCHGDVIAAYVEASA